MPVISTARMTARQYLMLGEDPPGVRLELVDGQIAVTATPSPRHSYAEKKLSWWLSNHLEENRGGLLLGNIDIVLGEYDVRRPDLIYFVQEREHLVQADCVIESPPDLCVEILTESSVTVDREDKFEQYANAGVTYYWIVDPHMQTIEGFELVAGRYNLVGSAARDMPVSLPPFPMLKISLREIWFPKQK